MSTPRKMAILVLVASLSLVILGPLTSRAQQSVTDSVSFGDNRYQVLIEFPPGGAAGAPLVLALHGYGGSIESLRQESGLSQLTLNGYGVMYVQGLPDPAGQAHWNANLDMVPRDDLSALLALLHRVNRIHKFDPMRVFVVGESNGGFMAFSLACRSEGVIAGIVSVNGTMSGRDWRTCSTKSPVPVLRITGGEDTVVPVDGSMTEEGGWGGAPDADTVDAAWAARFGPVTRTDTKPAPFVQQSQYVTDTGRTVVTRVHILPLGHDWPQTQFFDFDVLPIIRNFLAETEAQRHM